MKLTHKKSKYFETAQAEMIDLCKKKQKKKQHCISSYYFNVGIFFYYCE